MESIAEDLAKLAGRGWVILSEEPELLSFDLLPGSVIWCNVKGNSDADALPIQFWGLKFILDVDAQTLYGVLIDWLNGLRAKRWAFITPLPNGTQWHVQANWLLREKSDDGLTLSASLRAFAVCARAGADFPRVYEYVKGEEGWAIELLRVTVRRVHDARCMLTLTGQSQGGKVLVERTVNYLQKLYVTRKPSPQPVEATEELIEPDPKAPLEHWFEYYHKQKEAGKRITLADIAKRTAYTPSYIRKQHALYAKRVGVERRGTREGT